MSPRGGVPPGRPDRAALEALRARMEAAGRTPAVRRSRPAKGKKATRARREDDCAGGQPGADDSRDADRWDADRWDADRWDERPEPDVPTPLDQPDGGESRRWWEEHPGGPIPVEDGIVAATRRGPIGATWWSQRFLSALEAVLVGGRMERGRAYARKGQVVTLAVGPGAVTAVVQGSRTDPYRVRLAMPPVPDGEWEEIIDRLGAQARYSALMLAGELPHEVEQVFEAAGASLFPGPQARLVTECTCPDFENPCKHIAAVCYLLAERFDRDPFQVLEWRGRDRRSVVDALRRLRTDPRPAHAGQVDGSAAEDGGGHSQAEGVGATGAGATGAGATGSGATGAGGTEPRHPQVGAQPEPVELPAQGFWDASPGLSEVRVRPDPAAVPDAVLRQLPRDLLVIRGRDVADVLSAAYAAFTAAAARRAGS